ncbi:MAG TPA: sugar ABC transporter permease [Alphaproteobacteria bacterium]|nr:sugar ABC transporter permease [Alphaproteobacteria bacterium]
MVVSPRKSLLDLGTEKTFVWVCMVPVLVFLIVVAIAPTTAAVIDSFRELSLTVFTKRGEFIGLDNYRELVGEDASFYTAVWHTAIFMAVVVPFEFVLGLAIALWINREFAGRRLVLTIIMIPTMIAPVVVGMIWRFFLMPSFGVLTVYMNRIGWFEETSIFSGPTTAFGALMIIDIWEWTPFVMLILLAGLTAMPKAPIEAATLDGASRWQILWHVQLPLLKPLIIIALMLRTIDASKIFDTIYVLTGGGPGDATEVISTFAYRTNFLKWDLGYGAAVCLVLAFVSLVVAGLFYKIVSGQSAAKVKA